MIGLVFQPNSLLLIVSILWLSLQSKYTFQDLVPEVATTKSGVTRQKKNSCTARNPSIRTVVQVPSCVASPGIAHFSSPISFKPVVRMFRASLRSVSDPLRDHVCFSCLARRFAAPTNLRRFHRVPALRAQFSSENGGSSATDTSAVPSMAHWEQDSSSKVCYFRSRGSCIIW